MSNNRRSSVNQKISLLLEESMRTQFDDLASHVTGPKAERILARRRLYGVGTGGDMPRVRKLSGGFRSKAEARNTSPPSSPPGYPAGYPAGMPPRGGSLATNSMSSLGFGDSFYQDSFEGSAASRAAARRDRPPSKARYAHDGMYSVITFPGRPDRMLHNSIPTGESPHFPRWYMGRDNSAAAPIDARAAAERYGNRGSYNMKLHSLHPAQSEGGARLDNE
jgi:hypothetical protein